MQKFVMLLLLFFPSFLSSSTKNITATRTDKKIDIDGRLDEPAWREAEPSGNFVQKYPVSDTIPAESTTVKVLYDNKYLYVGVRAYDSEPEGIVGRLSRRDIAAGSDYITVYVDSYLDRKTAYTFKTNPLGVKIDWYIYDDLYSDGDWDAVWDIGTSIDSLGWIAEFSIPFSILRFQNRNSLTFGFEVVRYISRKRETDEWTFIPEDARGFVSFFGKLTGIKQIPTPKNLELLPYGMGRLIREKGESDYFYNAGCDIKYGIGSNFILDATVNPDFGQVEADPSQLNLSLFETYFSEKRPFFIEGKDLFKTHYELFYSRRIGKAPEYFDVLPEDIIKEQPAFTTIIGAMKLTGKIKGSNFGVVEAVTAPEYAVVDSSGIEKKRLIEPLTNYSVVRIKQDVFKNSDIGIIGTACNRKEANAAYSGGIDWNFKILNNYSSKGQFALSKTDDWGYADYLSFGKTGGRPFNWGVNYSEVSKTFDIKALGYIYRNNERNAWGWLSLFTSDQWWLTHRMSTNLNVSGVCNFEGIPLYQEVYGGYWVTFRNYSRINLWLGHNFAENNDWITRGGPVLHIPSSYWANLGCYSDSRKLISFGIFASTWKSGEKSFGNSVSPYLNLKPFSNLKITFSPGYSHSFDYAEWVQNIDDNADGEVDHYVFGELTTDILSASIRSDVAFTKDLTLQLWMQPYIAVGAYSNFKELVDADRYEFTDYETDLSPDFNRKFLKTNVVLRWEYSPGSTLFFVITNGLYDFSHPGDFSPVRDIKTLFKAEGERIYLLKINKWWTI